MTRLWLLLVVFAVMFCCLVAYARHEAQQDAHWDEVCAKVRDEMLAGRKGGKR